MKPSFSPLSKLTDRAIYFADVFFLYFNIFFNDRLTSNVCFSESNGPIFAKISVITGGMAC